MRYGKTSVSGAQFSADHSNTWSIRHGEEKVEEGESQKVTRLAHCAPQGHVGPELRMSAEQLG